MISEQDLAWLQKTCGCASAGPWKWKSGTNRLVSAAGETVLAFDTSNLAYHPSQADRRFIHEASLWMASLVSEVRLLQNQADDAKALLHERNQLLVATYEERDAKTAEIERLRKRLQELEPPEQCPMCGNSGVVRIDNHGAKEEWTEDCQCRNPSSQGGNLVQTPPGCSLLSEKPK